MTATTFTPDPGIQVGSVSYLDGTLRVTLRDEDVAALSTAEQELARAGLKIFAIKSIRGRSPTQRGRGHVPLLMRQAGLKPGWRFTLTHRRSPMFQVITRNSAYTVEPAGTGFIVRRTADMWGRKVSDSHYHYTRSLRIVLGQSMLTDKIQTSPVRAITAAD